MDRIVNGQRVVKCDKCIELRIISKVVSRSMSRTMLGHKTFYDEHGYFHDHDPNTTTEFFVCSNDHKWRVRKRAKDCPQQIGCDWGNNFQEEVTWVNPFGGDL